MSFQGQVAISTGAASGMGLLFAENFAALGGNVVMCDVNEAVLLLKILLQQVPTQLLLSYLLIFLPVTL